MLAIVISAIILNAPRFTDPYGGHNDFARFQGRIISDIEIVRRNVFDDRIRKNTPFYFRWGNALHIITKEGIISNELLFEVGDPLDSLRIIESQRNLRLRGFISEVFVAGKPNGSDSVDLTVTTVDYWTTKIALYAELDGGVHTLGAAASEINFLGNGQTLEIGGQTSSDEDSYSIFVADGRLGGTRLAGQFYYTGTTYGDGVSA